MTAIMGLEDRLRAEANALRRLKLIFESESRDEENCRAVILSQDDEVPGILSGVSNLNNIYGNMRSLGVPVNGNFFRHISAVLNTCGKPREFACDISQVLRDADDMLKLLESKHMHKKCSPIGHQ